VGAAAGVDYIYARTGFGIALSVALGAGSAVATAWQVPLVLVGGRVMQILPASPMSLTRVLKLTLIQHPVMCDGAVVSALVAGVVGGVAVGTALAVAMPAHVAAAPTSASTDPESCGDDDDARTSYSPWIRAMALHGLTLVVQLAESAPLMTGGGALGVIVISAAAAHQWGPAAAESAGTYFTALWNAVGQPLLFVLIGAAVDVRTLNGDVVGKVGVLQGPGQPRSLRLLQMFLKIFTSCRPQFSICRLSPSLPLH
jgi:hypothetical protein